MANIVDIIINATDNASRQIDQVTRAIDRVGSQGGKLTSIMAGVAGSVAALGPAVAGVMGLAAGFAGAGIAAGAYGAVAVSVLGKVFEKNKEIKKIEEELANATTTEQREAAQKKLQQAMEGVNGAQKKAMADLRTFQSFWGQFTQQFEKPIFQAFGTGLELLQRILQGLAPTITAVSGVVNTLLTQMNTAVIGGGMTKFFNWLATTGAQSLYNFAVIGGNLIKGFFNILMAFSPIGATMETGLVSLTARFAAWSSTLSQSQGFQNFINFAKTNGPVVISLIGNLWNFLVKLVVALAPLGAVVLQVAASFAQWLAQSNFVKTALGLLSAAGTMLANNLGLVKTVLAAVVAGFVAFRVVTTVISIVKTAISIFRVLKTVVTTVRTVFLLFNATLLANPITWVIVGIVALIAIGVLLYKNWDKVTATAKKMYTAVKGAVDKMKNAFKQGIANIISAIAKWASNMKSKISSMMNDAQSKVRSGLDKVLSFFRSIPGKVGSALSSLVSQLRSKFTSAMNAGKSAVSSGVRNIISAIKGFIGTFTSAGKGLLDAFTKGIKSGISKAAGAVKSGMSKIRSFLPFSPAKKGPLSDLDKSGESFFPTWYNGALTKVRPMTKAIGSAMENMNGALQGGYGEALTSFSGGRSSVTVVHRHEHSGNVNVKGDSGSQSFSMVGSSIKETTERDVLGSLRQEIRKR